MFMDQGANITLTNHIVGRPLKFQSVDELEVAIQQYFNSREPHIAKTKIKVTKADGTYYWQEDEELIPAKPKTMSGLARALGVHRSTLINYKGRPDFFDSIAAALAECEEYAEEQLFIGRNANGAVFVLKNNYGWSDRKQIENFNREMSEAEVLDALKHGDELMRQSDEEAAHEVDTELARMEVISTMPSVTEQAT